MVRVYGFGAGVKGKEKQTVGELYDLFESVASDIWPAEGADDNSDTDAEGNSEALEDQISNEIAAMKKPQKDKRFGSSAVMKPLDAKLIL
ncbi:hypothetical protein AAF712_005052 [Marasmius tenuissimus]|uniref:Uncharacterized protein n=1 Tax=Marasmius tenuissimus TaxID=585030 RepID=A0ABR3A4G4_9AGAR